MFIQLLLHYIDILRRHGLSVQGGGWKCARPHPDVSGSVAGGGVGIRRVAISIALPALTSSKTMQAEQVQGAGQQLTAESRQLTAAKHQGAGQ